MDNQLFGTFCACSKLLLRQTPKQAQNRENLKDLLRVNAGGIIFTTIQKFEESNEVLSERNNIIFMADEAHRSQYGLDGKLNRKTGEWKYGMAKHMRDSLPNATFIGFTGTPIDFDDKSTVEVFGDYIDIYDMTQAVEDGATVPIYYENRTAKLKLSADLLKKIDAEYDKLASEASEIAIEKSKSDLSSIEAIIGSKERLGMLADDIIAHYEDRQYVLTGKAMVVCMTRRIAINLYKIILEKRPEWENKIKVVLTSSNKDEEEWHDIIGNKAYRDQLMIAFKDEKSEFKIAVVVDMWLTGFDVPSMATMYIDKPMKGHNLMQAIARVNRVYKDKEAGLIVDYIGMAAELKAALGQYTKRDQDKIPDLGQETGEEKGLSTEELAFYDALAADPEVLKKMQDKVLVEMAQELTDLIRRSRTVDWDKKESARAYMRTQIKHLLRKYKYPPEKAKGAIDIVIKQAELMSSNINPKSVVYDFQPKTKPLMVAEDSGYGMNEKNND